MAWDGVGCWLNVTGPCSNVQAKHSLHRCGRARSDQTVTTVATRWTRTMPATWMTPTTPIRQP